MQILILIAIKVHCSIQEVSIYVKLYLGLRVFIHHRLAMPYYAHFAGCLLRICLKLKPSQI